MFKWNTNCLCQLTYISLKQLLFTFHSSLVFGGSPHINSPSCTINTYYIGIDLHVKTIIHMALAEQQQYLVQWSMQQHTQGTANFTYVCKRHAACEIKASFTLEHGYWFSAKFCSFRAHSYVAHDFQTQVKCHYCSYVVHDLYHVVLTSDVLHSTTQHLFVTSF